MYFIALYIEFLVYYNNVFLIKSVTYNVCFHLNNLNAYKYLSTYGFIFKYKSYFFNDLTSKWKVYYIIIHCTINSSGLIFISINDCKIKITQFSYFETI